MAITAAVPVSNGDFLAAVRNLLTRALALEDIDAVLVPARLPMKNRIMPILAAEEKVLSGADPLGPAFALNGAKLLSRLTRKPAGGRILAVQRPCELRAFTELVKLKQADPEGVLFVGIDCLGAYRNSDYHRFAEQDSDTATGRFVRHGLRNEDHALDGFEIAAACKVCEHPVPEKADLRIGLFGVDVDTALPVEALTPDGEKLLQSLGLEPAAFPSGRKKAVEERISRRIRARDEMVSKTRAATENLEKLSAYLADCTNCYNCRVACPVCYCRECVFVTDVFDHDPAQYLQWAKRKGAVKMPTDTVFYHLTRLVHMSTACVGCGQCSNACPNDIPVMELFRTTAERTQTAFGYLAGRSVEERPPLSEFRENEFPEVVGI